jgi:hypothetical protein
MPNAPQQTPPTRNGAMHAVPCPFCGKPNDFRDIQHGMPGQAFVDTGDAVICDHCKGTMKIVNVQTATIFTVAKHKAPANRPAQQPQQQRPTSALGAGLRKLLGRG